MSRNQIGGYAQGSYFDHIAIEEGAVHFDRRITPGALTSSSSLGSRRGWDRGRIEHAVFHVRNFSESGHDLRAALLFHVGRASRLILVIVIQKDGLDIRHFEA